MTTTSDTTPGWEDYWQQWAGTSSSPKDAYEAGHWAGIGQWLDTWLPHRAKQLGELHDSTIAADWASTESMMKMAPGRTIDLKTMFAAGFTTGQWRETVAGTRDAIEKGHK